MLGDLMSRKKDGMLSFNFNGSLPKSDVEIYL